MNEFEGHVNSSENPREQGADLLLNDMLMRFSRDIILVVRRADGRILAANSAAEKAYGYSSDQLLGMRIHDLRAPETSAHTDTQLSEAENVGGTLFETIHRRCDGATFPVEVSSRGAALDGQKILVSIIRDITRRKKVEQSLHESETKFAKAFLNSPGFVFITEIASGTFVAANNAFCRLTGWPREELIGRTSIELNMLSRQNRADLISSLVADGCLRDQELQIRTRAGEALVIIFSAEIMDFEARRCVIFSGMDITKRKRAQQELVQRERQYRELAENSPEAIARFDRGQRFLFLNEYGAAVYGRQCEWIIGKTLPELGVSVEHAAFWQKQLESVFDSGRASTVEFEFTGPYQGYQYFSSLLVPEFDNDGNVSSILTITRDITRLKAVEAALRESEERFRTLADNMSQLAWMADEKGAIFWFNQRWFEYTGTTLAQMQEAGWTQVLHPDDLRRVLRRIQHSWDTGEPWEDTFPMRGRNGEYRWFLSRALPISDDQGRIVRWFGTNTDITERLQDEERIKQSLQEKEALLREIHHRVKNNMQVINSLMSLQSNQLRDDALKVPFREASSRVNAMALIHDIVFRSESFSQIELQVYLEKLVASLIQTYNVTEIKTSIRADAFHLNMDQAVPCGLMINELISNAFKYAFPDGRRGTVTVDASVSYDGRLIVQVSDDGVGMPDSFDPSHLDTLGLKLVWGLAESQLDGRIEMTSAKGQGTSFRIDFPRTETFRAA